MVMSLMTWNVNTNNRTKYLVNVRRLFIKNFIKSQTFAAAAPDVLFIQEATAEEDVNSVLTCLNGSYHCEPQYKKAGDPFVLISNSLAETKNIEKIDLPDIKRYVKMFIYLYLN